jgi:hypothetical protein
VIRHTISRSSRAARQPFQIAGGLDRLLDAYRAHSGLGVSTNQVHLHELCLIAGWHRAARVRSRAKPAAAAALSDQRLVVAMLSNVIMRRSGSSSDTVVVAMSVSFDEVSSRVAGVAERALSPKLCSSAGRVPPGEGVNSGVNAT